MDTLLSLISEDVKVKGGGIMLGLTDGGIIAAYLLVIGSAVLCIVYGWINWGKD